MCDKVWTLNAHHASYCVLLSYQTLVVYRHIWKERDKDALNACGAEPSLAKVCGFVAKRIKFGSVTFKRELWLN